MKMMLFITFPTKKFNELWKAGQVGPKIQQIIEETQPQAIYFGKSLGGKRGAVAIVDVPNGAVLSNVTEPWYLTFEADVETTMCMTPEDIGQIDMQGLAERWA